MISSRFLLFSLCGSAGLSGVSSDWKGGAGREEESLGCVRRRLSQETSFEAGLQGCRVEGRGDHSSDKQVWGLLSSSMEEESTVLELL